MRDVGRRIALGVSSAAARRRQLRVGEYGILRGLSFGTETTELGTLSEDDNKENLAPWGPGLRRNPCRRWVRGKKKVLPWWYPRTPLRDITAIVNAIERRRTRLHAIGEPANINTVIEEANSSIGSSDPEVLPSTEAHDSLPSASHATSSCDPPLESGKSFQDLEHAVMENIGRTSHQVNLNPQKKSTLMSMR